MLTGTTRGAETTLPDASVDPCVTGSLFRVSFDPDPDGADTVSYTHLTLPTTPYV